MDVVSCVSTTLEIILFMQLLEITNPTLPPPYPLETEPRIKPSRGPAHSTPESETLELFRLAIVMKNLCHSKITLLV